MAPIKVPFSYELATAPVEQDLTNVAAGCGALTVRLDGLETGDTVQQAVFTADATGAGAAVVKEISPTANDDGEISTVSLNSRQRTLAFTFTAADIATIAAGDYTYAVRVWVLRDSETRDREVLVGAIDARAAVVTTEGVSAVATVTVTPATASGNVGATDQLAAVAKDVDGNTLAGITFTWSTSDETVASVDASGLVTYVTPGIATITAKAHGAKDTCEVTSNNVGFSAAANGDYPVSDGAGGWTPQNPETRFYPKATVDTKDTAVAAAAAADATSKANAAQAAAISAAAADATTKANAAQAAAESYADAGFAALDASALVTGTIPDARFPAVFPAASGANLTLLNASALASGSIPDARVPATAVTQHQAALSIAIGQVTGLLDGSSKILTTLLPALAITDTFVVASQAAMLALAAQTGDVVVRTDLSKSFILRGTDPSILADWQELLTPTDTVTSVNGLTGAVTLTPGIIGAVDPGASYSNPAWITALAGTKITGDIAGNAGTATKLATARTINGVSFDGTANITVPAAAGTLTGTTLAATVTASSLTSVGTLTGLNVAGATECLEAAGVREFRIERATNGTDVRLQTYASRTLHINQLGNPLAIGGSVTMATGTTLAAQAITATAPVNGYALSTTSTTTPGQSFGAFIVAGTNASDYALYVRSAAGTDYFTVRGDGLSTFGGSVVISGASNLTVSGAFGCNGATAQTKATLGAAATDLATVLTLANNIRTALINNGIGQN